jgi:uncharacterized integral membrane protein (TIGR00698 family)
MSTGMLMGLGVCIIFAGISTFFGDLQHIIGAPMIGLFLGALAGNIKPAKGDYKKGTTYAAKKLLKFGIILAGATLNFNAIIQTGGTALPLIITNICMSFLTALLVGKMLGVSINTRRLVGSGTAICGGTAIATVSPIINANDDEMAYALTAIFLFDVFAALAFPFIAQGLNLSPEQFGLLAGTAISDTSSVVAAGDTFAKLIGVAGAAELPVIVKLTRTTFLVVVAVVFTIVMVNEKRKEAQLASANGGSDSNDEPEKSFGKIVIDVFPLFILGFLGMAVLNTFGIFPEAMSPFFKKGYKFLVTTALVGVGYKINIKDLFTKGVKPMILGGVTWVTVAIVAMAYILIVM